MKDDGATSVSGDDVLGDGVYTLKVDLNKAGGYTTTGCSPWIRAARNGGPYGDNVCGG